jgi:hypothetical protein
MRRASLVVKLRGRQTKIVLETGDGGLRFRTRFWSARKMGFAMPVGNWLRTDLRALVHDHVLHGPRRPRLFGAGDHSRLLARARCGMARPHDGALGAPRVQSWYERFMGAPP